MSCQFVCLITTCVPAGLKMASDPLVVELETVVSHHVRAGNWTWVIWKNRQWSQLLSQHLKILRIRVLKVEETTFTRQFILWRRLRSGTFPLLNPAFPQVTVQAMEMLSCYNKKDLIRQTCIFLSSNGVVAWGVMCSTKSFRGLYSLLFIYF